MKKTLLLFCLAALTRYSAMAQAGSLDNSFGTNGIATIPVGSSNDNARAVAIQADGKILVAGRSAGTVINNNFSVCRLKTDGSLDDEFDGDGIVIIPVGSFGGIAMAVAIQPDGKILVGGRGFYDDDEDFAVVRLMPGGSLDPDFGVGGIAHVGFELFTDERLADMALQQDGKIVLTGASFFSGIDGFFVVRLDSDGNPDSEFGDNGKKIIQVNGSSWSEARSVAVQTDGKIVLGGISSTNNTSPFIFTSSVVRLLPNGDPDPTFGTSNGEVTLVTNEWNQCNSVLLQPDGKILMAGQERNSLTQRDGFLIARLTTTGSLDNSFGASGKVVLFQDISFEATRAQDMVLQPDGQIIVVGNLLIFINGNLVRYAAIRLTSGGALDNSFGDEGLALVPLTSEESWDVTLQADGKIVIAAGPSNIALGIDFVVIRLNGDDICQDADNDGYDDCSGDCDDNNPTVHPGATEVCNGIDDNCNGQVDEGLVVTWYRDADGDGFGNLNINIQSCSPQAGYVSDNTDCDDSKIFYTDNDGDGFGAGVPAPCGVEDNTDCNDADISIHAPITYYQDSDGDGWGNPATAIPVCQLTPPPGYVLNNQDCDDSKLLHTDFDNDGYGSILPAPCGIEDNTDCDDNNFNINPGAPEDACNGIDNDCDGLIDEGIPTFTYYLDNDNDGWGVATQSVQDCRKPDGYTINPGDCNDNNPTINPAISETCNDIDDNCNGLIDENAPPYFLDNDGDGFGSNVGFIFTCNPPAGYVAIAGDCNDNDPGINPSAPEICNGIDDNCDLQIDEGLTLTTFYKDNDGDGYGTVGIQVQACIAPAGYASLPGDCDDNDPTVNPEAAEVCNSRDDNCNGEINEGLIDTYYRDSDGDGYGNPLAFIETCFQPSGYVTNSDDCWDSDPSIHPGAAETCNDKDDNCDGVIDEGFNKLTYYRDADGDGFGDPNNSVQACSLPFGYVTNNGDCDDGNDTIHPNATEYCNGIDENCNGAIDDNPVLVTWYRDADGDGWGDPDQTVQACSPPAGYIREALDCDDSDPNVNPAANESANNEDDNCDGQVDEGLVQTFYRDTDGDGFGDPNNSIQASTLPAGYVVDNSDCNDNNSAIHPGAAEACNGIDDDCDGQIDEDVVMTTWYFDGDSDGFGNANNSIQACTAPTGYVSTNSDCNDNNAAINPLATETCNGTDDDCDGQIDEGVVMLTWYSDGDDDGFGDPGISIQACAAPTAYVSNNLDCDDNNATIRPGAPESCNGIDDDCDGIIDEDVVILSWYFDSDGDGFGDANISIQACAAPTGYVSNNSDCDDNNAAIHPGATETCNGIDDNCDGQIDEGVVIPTWYFDGDSDGFGDPNNSTQACTTPNGYVSNNSDCNDNNAAIRPGVAEICNGIDDDCDGQIDEGVVIPTWYFDGDSDGFGNPNNSTQACTVPTGYVGNNTDCDDTKLLYADNDGDGFGAGSPVACGVATNTDCNDNDGTINPSTVWFLDADNDNYYAGNGITQCNSPGTGYKKSGVIAGGDCDDGNTNINPGSTEVCGNNVDDNCSGLADENCSATPIVSINDITVYESQNQAILTITLSRAAATAVKVSYKTIDGSAFKPKDYKNTSGTVTIAAGNLSAQLTVIVVPDNVNEGPEFFDVQISLPKVMGQLQPAIVGDGMGRVTILNGAPSALALDSPKNISNDQSVKGVTEVFNARVTPNPSPAEFTLRVESSSDDPMNIRVFDMQGRLIKKLSSNSSYVKFGHDLIPGVYIVEVLQRTNKKTMKVIKL